MATYRIAEFRRDGLVGWTVESSEPRDRSRPRRLYPTSEQAQAEADRLTAVDAAAEPAATVDPATATETAPPATAPLEP